MVKFSAVCLAVFGQLVLVIESLGDRLFVQTLCERNWCDARSNATCADICRKLPSYKDDDCCEISSYESKRRTLPSTSLLPVPSSSAASSFYTHKATAIIIAFPFSTLFVVVVVVIWCCCKCETSQSHRVAEIHPMNTAVTTSVIELNNLAEMMTISPVENYPLLPPYQCRANPGTPPPPYNLHSNESNLVRSSN